MLGLAEQRYQAFFEASRDAIFIIDNDLEIIIDANKEALELVEQPLEQIIGLPISLFEIFNQLLLAIGNYKDFKNEFNDLSCIEFRKPNGTTIFIEVKITKIKYGDQYLSQFIFHDITALKLIENKLQEHDKNVKILNKIIAVANEATSLNELFDNILTLIKGFLNLDGVVFI